MTPEEIQQAREVARETVNPGAWFTPGHAWIALMARAVLTLTEQQPEPVSRETLAGVLRRLTESDFGTGAINPDTAAAVLLSRYTITARPVVSSPDGDSR